MRLGTVSFSLKFNADAYTLQFHSDGSDSGADLIHALTSKIFHDFIFNHFSDKLLCASEFFQQMRNHKKYFFPSPTSWRKWALTKLSLSQWTLLSVFSSVFSARCEKSFLVRKLMPISFCILSLESFPLDFLSPLLLLRDPSFLY